MEPEGSLPHSQVPATCPYSDPVWSGPRHLTSRRSVLLLFSHLRLGLASGLFPSGFPTKTPNKPLLSPIHPACPAYLILIDLITRRILDEEYRSLSSSVCSFLHSPFASSLLGQNIILSTLFSNTHSLRFSLNLSDQVLHSYKTRKIMVLYSLISFIFVESKLEDKTFCTEW